MNLTQKDQVAAEINSDEVVSELCSKYYDLKNKELSSRLTLAERASMAREIIEGCKENEMYFYRRLIDSPSHPVTTNFKTTSDIVNLASNDYLGLTRHAAITKAGISELERSGSGAGSVPMLAGSTTKHKRLEASLATFCELPSAILYNSCYAANYGLLTALLTPSDAAILDMSVHASIVDGCCNTNKIFFKHNDPESLKIALKKAASFTNKIVITEGVFSMDGDISRLDEIIQIAREESAWIMLDESHALGVIGENGKGTHSHYSLNAKADIISCSLGKSLGGLGGFISGSKELIALLELTSRSFIFSTALPPNMATQLHEALQLIQTDFSMHDNLWENIRYFRNGIADLGFESTNSASAIVPIIIRDEVKLMNFCQELNRENIFVNPILYPVVPKKRARIRISITSSLEKSMLDRAMSVIEYSARKFNIV